MGVGFYEEMGSMGDGGKHGSRQYGRYGVRFGIYGHRFGVIDGLNLKPKKISRMYFVDESKSSIQKAFKERKPLENKETDLDEYAIPF